MMITSYSPHKIYLGDGVYADTDGYQVILTTEDGITTHNTIFLEEPVLRALQSFVSRMRDKDLLPKSRLDDVPLNTHPKTRGTSL